VLSLITGGSILAAARPGDSHGPPQGAGTEQKPPRWPRPGDCIRIVIDKDGTLTNPVPTES